MTGAEIRAVRQRLGLSQTSFAEALARALGAGEPVHWTTVSRWENDRVEPPPYLALALRYLAEHPESRSA